LALISVIPPGQKRRNEVAKLFEGNFLVLAPIAVEQLERFAASPRDLRQDGRCWLDCGRQYTVSQQRIDHRRLASGKLPNDHKAKGILEHFAPGIV
jgi:hypothetical protein